MYRSHLNYLHEPRLLPKPDASTVRDEGRSQRYGAKSRNTASAGFRTNPFGMRLRGRTAASEPSLRSLAFASVSSLHFIPRSLHRGHGYG